MLYAGATRRVCFLETLAPFRPSLSLLSQLRLIRTGPAGYDVPQIGSIPDDVLARLIGSFHLQAGQRWFDFRSAETYQALREDYPDTIMAFGHDDFDASHALSADRDLTQAIARLAFQEGFDGIVYKSRLEPALNCWALFDRCRIDLVAIDAIAADDPDLVQVAALFGLTVG